MKIIFICAIVIACVIISPAPFIGFGPGHFSYPQDDVNRDLEAIKFESFYQLFHTIYGEKVAVFGDQANIGGIEQTDYRLKILFDNYPGNLEGQKISIIQLSNIKFGVEDDKKFFTFVAAPWNRKVFDAGKYQIPIRMTVESMNNNRLVIGPVLFQTPQAANVLSRTIVENFNTDVAGKSFDVFYELLSKSRADYPTWGRALKASLSIFLPGYTYEFKPISESARFVLVLQKIFTFFLYFMIIAPIGFILFEHFKSFRSKMYGDTALGKIDKDKK